MERNLTNQRVQSRATHITVRNSGTLNRHFVKAPRKIVFSEDSDDSDEFSDASDIRTPATPVASAQSTPTSYTTPAPAPTAKKITISFDSLRESLKNNATMRPTSNTPATSVPKPRPTTSHIQISTPLDFSAPAPVTAPLDISAPAPVASLLDFSAPAPVAKPTPASIPRPLNISEPTSTPISFTIPIAPVAPAIPVAMPTPVRPVSAAVTAARLTTTSAPTAKPLTNTAHKTRSTIAPLQSLAERRREADTISHFSAKKLTNRARQNSKALMSAMKEETKPKSAPIMIKKPKVSKKHLIFAVASSICCMGVLYATLKFSMPDISAKVAAAQNGASYPSFVPRDFIASGASFQKNTFTLEFVGPNKTHFTLDQEKLPWDSNALLNNYVKPTWGEQYDTIREQGLTIYMYQSNAAWVNGGTVYKLNTTSGSLSKKQLKNIITSL
jgi:mucin-5AC (fragments)